MKFDNKKHLQAIASWLLFVYNKKRIAFGISRDENRIYCCL